MAVNKTLERIRELAPTKKVRPDGYGITAREYAEAEGMNHGAASKMLRKFESDGILKSENMRYNGKAVVVYTVVK